MPSEQGILEIRTNPYSGSYLGGATYYSYFRDKPFLISCYPHTKNTPPKKKKHPQKEKKRNLNPK
jgi:hypothetical protein